MREAGLPAVSAPRIGGGFQSSFASWRPWAPVARTVFDDRSAAERPTRTTRGSEVAIAAA